MSELPDIRVPTAPGEIEDLKRRVRDLERVLGEGGTEFEFSISGAAMSVPAVDAVTNPWSPDAIADMAFLVVDLDAPADGESSWAVRKNGEIVETATVADGDDHAIIPAPATYFTGDRLDFQAVDPGSGWSKATVRAVFRATRAHIESATLIFPVASSGGGLKIERFFAGDDITLTSAVDSADVGPWSAYGSPNAFGFSLSGDNIVIEESGIYAVWAKALLEVHSTERGVDTFKRFGMSGGFAIPEVNMDIPSYAWDASNQRAWVETGPWWEEVPDTFTDNANLSVDMSNSGADLIIKECVLIIARVADPS